ncbi:hypothetical protein AYO38_04140 [bacterium SCGC AG-212-C10]|nr:hypothetical protein AYO38_04140 [bacterium SCGC AG-212-C10]
MDEFERLLTAAVTAGHDSPHGGVASTANALARVLQEYRSGKQFPPDGIASATKLARDIFEATDDRHSTA